MTTNADLAELLKIHKADISKNTARTYASLLRSLYYSATGSDVKDKIDTKWYYNQTEVLKALNAKDAKTRKTILAALLALVGKEHSAKYSAQMTEDIGEYNAWLEKQEKTEKQKENWKTVADIEAVVMDYETRAKAIMKKETALTAEDRKTLVSWMLLALTTGHYIPPRRSMDYALMKFRNYNKASDNFLDKNQFVFNQYKTAKTYNQQTIEIPRSFRVLITKYIRTIPDGVDTLLYDTKNGEMSSVKITQRLNALFGGARVSVSMLRHIYLTDKLGNIPRLEELNQLAEDMGHSRKMQLEYIKH
jgi:hypothetical protein